MDFEFKSQYDISDLLKIMKILRSDNGCPWDKVQTHESIRTDLIEETYEVCEGIDANSPEMLQEELGDLLMQVVFHSEIEAEAGRFDFNDVCDGICKKLVYRHPHVFGEVSVKDADEVLKNWDALKKAGKHQDTYSETLESVPKTFPALLRGEKVCKRAARAGLSENDVKECAESICEDIRKLCCGDFSGNDVENQRILGKILLQICNLSRIFKVDSEKALTYSTNMFIMNFRAVENEIIASGKKLEDVSNEELKLAADKVLNGL